MKKILLISAVTALAACSPAETTDEVAASTEATEVVAELTAADGGPSIGMFKVTSADGSVAMEEIRAGRYLHRHDRRGGARDWQMGTKIA